MKPNLIFGVVLMLAGGFTYALGLDSLDITLRIEAKSLQKEQMATALCHSGWGQPAAEPSRLSTTLNLSLSADSTAIGLSLQAWKQWLEVKLDGRGEGNVAFGQGYQRRSL